MVRQRVDIGLTSRPWCVLCSFPSSQQVGIPPVLPPGLQPPLPLPHPSRPAGHAGQTLAAGRSAPGKASPAKGRTSPVKASASPAKRRLEVRVRDAAGSVTDVAMPGATAGPAEARQPGVSISDRDAERPALRSKRLSFKQAQADAGAAVPLAAQRMPRTSRPPAR